MCIRDRPKPFAFASSGVGSSTHLLMEKFRAAAGIDAVHVPYKGSPEVLVEIASGRVDLTIMPPLTVMPMVRDKRAVAIAVSAPRRFAALPDTPTMREAGLKGNEYQIWIGFFAPSRVPAPIRAQLHKLATSAFATDEVKTRLAGIGMEPMPLAQAEFAQMLAQEFDENSRILRAAGVKPN